MRFTSSQTSFKSGRLSPKLFNRVDTTQYRDGASELKGFRVMPEGGITRVKGTRVINQRGGVYEPGVLNAEYQYPVKSFHVVVNGVTLYVTLKQTPANSVDLLVRVLGETGVGATAVDFGHQLIAGGDTEYPVHLFDWAFIDNTIVITHHSGTMAPAYVSIDKDTFGISVKRMKYGNAQDSLNTKPFPDDYLPRLPTRFPMSDIGRDVGALTVTQINANTSRLTGSAEDIAKIPFDGVVYIEAVGANTFSGDTGTYNYIWSELCLVTAKTTTTVDISVSKIGSANSLTFGGITSISMWAYSLWGDGNYPKTVTTHEGRLVFGGTPNSPLTIYGSKLNSPTMFCQLKRLSPGIPYLQIDPPYGDTTVADPYVYSISSSHDSEIMWIKSSGSLNIGTNRSEYIATGGDTILSALSVNIKPQTNEGSDPLSAVVGARSLFYTTNHGHKIMAFRYNKENGTMISEDITVLLSDLLENDRVVKIEWCPHISTMLILVSSGKLYGILDNAGDLALYDTALEDIMDLCFFPAGVKTEGYPRGDIVLLESSVYGLLSFEQSYYEYGLDDSAVAYEQIGYNTHLFLDNVIRLQSWFILGPNYPGLENGTDRLPEDNPSYPAMFSRINEFTGQVGAAVLYAEDKEAFLVPKFLYPEGHLILIEKTTRQAFEFFATEDHYDAGNEMYYWVIDDPELLVFEDFLVGKPVSPCSAATMPIEAGQQWGTAQMGIKNIDKIGIRAYKSYSVEVSSGEGTWEEIIFADEEGKAANSRKELNFSSSPKYDQIVYLRNTKAEPCTIIGLNMRGVSNDG